MVTNKQQRGDFRQLVHTPAELAAYYTQWATSIIDNPGIPLGIPALDKKVIPLRPGDLVGIIARPGMGKSSLMAYLAMQEARRIQKRDAVGKEAVVYVTWESSAEEIENFWMAQGQYSASDVAWGRVPLDVITRHAIKRPQLPIWTIGHAISKAGQPMPRMNLDAVLGAIESMQADFGIKPTLMLFDYIQLIPVDGIQDRQRRVTEVPPMVKELALRVGSPAVCGVQAAREVDDLKFKIPEMQHAQWASSIEQAADKLFSLWRPYRSEGPEGEPVRLTKNSRAYLITPELTILRMLKQRGDDGRATWALFFAPQYLKLAEMETEQGHSQGGTDR